MKKLLSILFTVMLVFKSFLFSENLISSTWIDSIIWCDVPAGNFTFGEGDTIKNIGYDYQIMKYEVTNIQFVTFLNEFNENGFLAVSGNKVRCKYLRDSVTLCEIEEFPSDDYNFSSYFFENDSFVIKVNSNYSTGDFDNHPASRITWFGAKIFAEYNGLRLPTEQEWEKAARGNTGYNFPWGDNIDGSYANYFLSGDPFDPGTTPVGYFDGSNQDGFQTTNNSSPYGCYDMAGNVLEWVDTRRDISTITDLMFRGGHWDYHTNYCNSWHRDGAYPWSGSASNGFRCVKGGDTAPKINELRYTPFGIYDTTEVTISMDIANGESIQGARLYWYSSINFLENSIQMSSLNDTTYFTDSNIPPFPIGTIIYYYAEVQDNHHTVKSDLKSYTVLDYSTNTGSVEDTDGNIYRAVKIGNQWWMAENLKVTHFKNGDLIPDYYVYNHEGQYADIYGRLYNNNVLEDERGLAPEGWHIPTADEWNTLQQTIGNNFGEKLKAPIEWGKEDGNCDGIDSYGFHVLPAGRFEIDHDMAMEDFTGMPEWTGFWNSGKGYTSFTKEDCGISDISLYNGEYYLSIRCVKDSTENEPPDASFNVSPGAGSILTSFLFDASSCSDMEDSLSQLQVRWDWENDGIWDTDYSTTKTKSHQYNLEGNYIIKLEVMDKDGLADTVTKQIFVKNIEDGLIAYYPFNGNADDESGNENNGVVHGAILTNDRFGNNFSAYQFDGDNDYINCGNDSSINISGSNSNITMSAWFYAEDVESRQNIISKGRDYTSNYGYHLNLNNQKNRGLYRLSDGTNNIVQTTPVIKTNTWYNVVTTFNGVESKIYINGILQNINTEIGQIGISTTNLIIGCHSQSPPAWYTFKGVIDDVRIYNKVLSDSDILNLFHENGWIDNNTPPIALFTATPDSGTTNTEFVFDANGSCDIEDSTSQLQVRWDWDNDGVWDTEYSYTKLDTHQYETPGTYTVKLIVMDTEGATDTSFQNIIVDDIHDTLIAYFPFNGNAKDSSGFKNDGIVYNASLTQDRFGNDSSAYYFDGDQDWIDIHTVTIPSNKSQTINLWVKSEDKGNQLSYFLDNAEYEDIYNRISIKNSSANNLHTLSTSYNGNVIHHGDPAYDDWDMVTVTMDGNYLRAFRNGTLTDSVASELCTLGGLLVGCINTPSGNWFLGSVDDLRFYNYCLSDNEILTLFRENGWTGNSAPDTVTDIDGNVYKTVKIGEQIWMAENLRVMHYQNGDPITKITVNSEWSNSNTGSVCNYENNDSNAVLYGSLYNHLAVHDNRKIAPEGWHIATDDDWKKLEIFAGMTESQADGVWGRGTDEGRKLKSETDWDGTDEFGFNIIPAGCREMDNGNYYNIDSEARFWTSTENKNTTPDTLYTWARYLWSGDNRMVRFYDIPNRGYSVRCVKNSETLNNSPNAEFNVTPKLGFVGNNFVFDCSNSSDIEDPISKLQVRWDWENDGTWDTEYNYSKLDSHQFENPGTYMVKLEVIDSQNLTDFSIDTIIVDDGNTGTVTDIDGNIYRTVKIGNQWWMAENLNVTHYNNGDPISNIFNFEKWENMTTGAYRVENHFAFYNGFCAADSRNVAPTGWHVPTNAEWAELINFVGDFNSAGLYLKSNYLWNNHNGIDSYDFTCLPTGKIHYRGFYEDYTRNAWFWTSSPYHCIYFDQYSAVIYDWNTYATYGFPVRCVMDKTTGNRPPTSVFEIFPKTGNVNTTFQFDASECNDSESSQLQFRWDWENDGNWDTEYTSSKVSYHQFDSIGTYNVKLEVIDSEGASCYALREVNVNDAGIDQIQLISGWNLISIDVIPDSNQVAKVFESIISQGFLDYVSAFDSSGAVFYDPNGLEILNTLKEVLTGSGLWVRVNHECTLNVPGVLISSDHSIPFQNGWNLVGYWLQNAQEAGTAFGALIDNNKLAYISCFSIPPANLMDVDDFIPL